jgi:hypothetical protein
VFDGFSDVEACRAFALWLRPILCMSTGGDGRGRTDNEVPLSLGFRGLSGTQMID